MSKKLALRLVPGDQLQEIMGKHYFEFLEEEYQRLTSQVQEALKQRQSNDVTSTKKYSNKEVDQMFARCYAVYQQMKAEVRKLKMERATKALGKEFNDRLNLYSVQLTALQEHYQMTRETKQEITFTFSIDDE